jgi:DNA-3-methyladenine glycosylase II
MPRHARGFDTEAATKHLARDRRFAPWLKKLPVVEPDPRWKKPFDPVDALARAIHYQQHNRNAAAPKD